MEPDTCVEEGDKEEVKEEEEEEEAVGVAPERAR
jgi:hypothetical protein